MSVLVGKPAPDFSERAVLKGEVLEDFTLSQFKGKKYVVLFFYPLDFTFICPTEMHAFQDKLAEFEKRNTQVIGVSVDSWFSHKAWLEQPKKTGGIQGIEFPIVSDFQKSITESYDVMTTEDIDGPTGAALRGTFLIDKEGIVQHQTVNMEPLGRNIDETLRMVDTLQFVEEHGEVCPANWNPGDKPLDATTEGLKVYFG